MHRLFTLLLFGLTAAGCASVAVGPTGVVNSGLGYEKGYVGIHARLLAESPELIAELDARGLTATKFGSVEGGAFTATALGGFKPGNFKILAGYTYGYQHADSWDKEITRPAFAVRYDHGNIEYGLLYEGLDSQGEVSDVIGATYIASPPRKSLPSLHMQVDYVKWSQGEKSGNGVKGSVSLLWEVWP